MYGAASVYKGINLRGREANNIVPNIIMYRDYVCISTCYYVQRLCMYINMLLCTETMYVYQHVIMYRDYVCISTCYYVQRLCMYLNMLLCTETMHVSEHVVQ